MSTRDVVPCGGGGGYVKKLGRIAVDIASSEASANIRQEPKVRLRRKFLFLTASALFLCATLALPQTSKAEDAVAALSSFAQQIDTPAAKAQANDQALAALQDLSLIHI